MGYFLLGILVYGFAYTSGAVSFFFLLKNPNILKLLYMLINVCEVIKYKKSLTCKPLPIFLGQDLIDCQSLQMVYLEKAFNHLFTLFADIVINIFKVPFLYLLEELSLTFGPKWIVPLQHHIEKNA